MASVEEIKPIETQEMFLNMGPQHPSTHGVLRLKLILDGETVIEATPDIGYLHRSLEKICENRTYVQIIPFLDRAGDYLSAMTNEYVFVKAVEELMGIKVPERAEYIRVIMLELQRIASHLLGGIGTFVMDLGITTGFTYTFRDREKIYDLFEMVCGGRLMYVYMRVGGVRYDLPSGFVERCRETMRDLEQKISEYLYLFDESELFLMRTQGVGVLKKEDAINLGASGPVLRASGVKADLRKLEPYSVYDQLDFDIPVRNEGETYARYWIRGQEIIQSIRIINQALDKLSEGEIMVKVPKVLRAPKGEVYTRVESPRGEIGVYLISDGTDKPYRLKLRTPSFCNVSILPHIVKGAKIQDLIAILASLDPVLSDVDR